ncbi:Rab-GTPase-TBC domain protein [Rhizoctonia solani]|uniref:Rab-GTPase-TBC domain protein n=1 Tax=Rhizoctonia solani TaxID=456999 RepID=A0A8H8NR82_9AGAM|nr:Rab-GTPase-TBC domain protein [Rhizoctonia solani]QRW18040.1 Rab-GTPase-TBC domain protein [Rhizoctonia solani]
MSFSHPLSNDPPPAGTRRRAVLSRPTSNYSSVKNASDERIHVPRPIHVIPKVDLGVRAEQLDTPQTAVPPETKRTTPLPRTPVLNLVESDDDPTSSLVLSTRWHTLSDQEIQSSIASLSSVQSPSEESKHPYHETIRILSATCERLVKQAAALERARKSLQQQEARRKRAAEQAVKELKPGQRDTGQQLLQAIYGLEPTETIQNNTLHPTSKSPQSLPMSLSEAMEEVWTPPAREAPVLKPTLPLDIPPSEAKLSRSRASSFTPASSTTSYSVRSDKTGGSKTFLGGWFGRSVPKNSITPEPDDRDGDIDADVVSVASGNGGNATAKMVTGVLRKGRNVFNAFGITPTSAVQRSAEEPTEADTLSYSSSPASRITSLPFQAPLVSPVLAVTTFSTKAPSIAAFSLDSGEHDPRTSTSEQPAPMHPAQYLRQNGHPTHLHAIVQATRVMSADPRSILVDTGEETSDLVAKGAMALVQNVKDEQIVAHEQGKSLERKRSRSRPRRPSTPAAGLGDLRKDDEDSDDNPNQSATASLGRALAIQELKTSNKAGTSGGGVGSKFRSLAPMAVAALSTPILSAFPRSNRSGQSPVTTTPNPANPLSSNTNTNPVAGSATQPPAAPNAGTGGTKKGRGTVELNSIVPVQLQPPTQFLSRAYTSSRLTSPDFKPQLASRFTRGSEFEGEGDEEANKKLQAQRRLGMTDRYGFIYGVNAYDVRLLQRARDASSSAPACLTGMKVQEREDENVKVIKPELESPDKVDVLLESADPSTSMTSSDYLDDNAALKSSASSSKSKPVGTKRSPTMNTLPRAAPIVTADTTPATADSTTASVAVSTGSLSTSTVVISNSRMERVFEEETQTPNLLSFMSADNERDSDEEKDWGMGIVGIDRMDAASAKEFARLVRGGIPLIYRDKVWSECAGAAEVREPGVFQDLLRNHEGEENPALKEIEKDVVRTMPLNVFFGGDGVGVAKLRRVLQAYSWRNPDIGYCQGMNLIASTLLLVFPNEEDAFWVLTCIIEKFLPPEFFSGSLTSSRACPLVLLDYVEIHHPRVYNHLLDMGVDLPAICFSWFLSMYTDCLPVETLFRVWDLIFADKLDALFRIGLAIIRINEPDLLACDSASGLYQYLEGMTARMWQADRLMKVESEIKNLMSHDDLVRRRDTHVAMLQSL